jgi:hypothetical protein
MLHDTMMVNKSYHEFTDDNLGSSTARKEGKSLSRVSVYSGKKLPNSWLITPGNGAILGTQCWFWPLADWAFGFISVSLILVRGSPFCKIHA